MNAVIRNDERNETRAAVDVLYDERADVGGVITDSGTQSPVILRRLLTAEDERE
jgi:hypothetical protein